MPAESNLEGSYLLEKDRIASFKKWPFTDKHKCNIKKVCSKHQLSWCYFFEKLLSNSDGRSGIFLEGNRFSRLFFMW